MVRLREGECTVMRQLQLEEALFRASSGTHLLLNEGPAPPASAVLGRSNRVDDLLDSASAARVGVPAIRRFTGGGTVLVDSNSLLTSLVANGQPGSVFPRRLMAWSIEMFQRAIPELSLHGTDYTLHRLKVGGNAQSISKSRFVVRLNPQRRLSSPYQCSSHLSAACFSCSTTHPSFGTINTT